jgi:pyruvate dehydrogenase E1 component alpha subunit
MTERAAAGFLPPIAGLARVQPRPLRTHERDFCLALLREMLRIRRFEERCAQLYGEQKIRGFLHLYIGEEAVAVGVMPQLRPSDNVVATYREHGHALLRGVPHGADHGRDVRQAARAARAAVAARCTCSTAPRASSAATPSSAAACRWRRAGAGRRRCWREGCVTACFFGEGAVAEGAFHESLNLAALWRLPVLFVCENNLYAMGTALSRSRGQTDI